MGELSPLHLILVLVIALIVVGPGKLPEVGAAVGKSIREFRKATSDVREAVNVDVAAPLPPAPVVPAPVAAPFAPAPVAAPFVPAPVAAPFVPAPVAAVPAPVAAPVAAVPAPEGTDAAPEGEDATPG